MHSQPQLYDSSLTSSTCEQCIQHVYNLDNSFCREQSDVLYVICYVCSSHLEWVGCSMRTEYLFCYRESRRDTAFLATYC